MEGLPVPFRGLTTANSEESLLALGRNVLGRDAIGCYRDHSNGRRGSIASGYAGPVDIARQTSCKRVLVDEGMELYVSRRSKLRYVGGTVHNRDNARSLADSNVRYILSRFEI